MAVPGYISAHVKIRMARTFSRRSNITTDTNVTLMVADSSSSTSASILSTAAPDPLRPTEHVTGIRLHGRNYEQWFDSDNRNERYNYLYSERELSVWKDRILNVAEKVRQSIT
jgi:uncharacterized protein YecE (DUF72 family)